MALSAMLVEINSGATAGNVNGGGFNPNNANMMTDLTTDANTANTSAPIVSSATYTFVAGDANHWLYIKSGTNWTPGFYKIQSVSGGKATLEAAIGSNNVDQLVNERWGTNTVVGCATVGTPTNGTFTIDYSRGTAAILSMTDAASVDASAVMTSATGGFTKAMIGNIIRLASGTNATVGWYEIVNHTDTNTVTIDRDCAGAGNLSAGVAKVGGALSLGSSDDAVFEALLIGSATTASKFFVVGNGTYTIGGTVTLAADATNTFQATIEGYTTRRGNRLTGSTRPVFACGANLFTWNGANTQIYGISFTGTGTSVVSIGNGCSMMNCKAVNSSTTAARNGFTQAATAAWFWDCEGVSYRGDAMSIDQAGGVFGGYYHDSDVGIHCELSSFLIHNALIASNVTAAIDIALATTGFSPIQGCTLYGAEGKLGIGVKVLSTAVRVILQNCIIYGFTTGVSYATASYAHYDNYNNYYNNTADVTGAANWQKGANDTALDPAFVNVQQRSGSTATTTAGNHLVQTGATFQTWGVTAGTHYLRLVSGTGVTAGIYGIASVDSETQITTDITLTADATADKVWAICTGLDWAVGTNMKAIGTPGAFTGSSTTAYTDIGAVQRQEAGGTTACNPMRGFIG